MFLLFVGFAVPLCSVTSLIN